MILVYSIGVGKSCLLLRFIEDKFFQEHNVTIGIEFGIKYLKINDNIVKINIWDTAGQEQFRAITTAYYKGSAAALLVYDITRKDTFNNLTKWIKDLKDNGSPSMSIVLIGNKSDLNDQRQVTQEEGKQFALEQQIEFMEVSAKNNHNVVESFTIASKFVIFKVENGTIDITNEKFGVKPGNINGQEYVDPKFRLSKIKKRNKKKCCNSIN